MRVQLTLELRNGLIMSLYEVRRNLGQICIAMVKGLCVQ